MVFSWMMATALSIAPPQGLYVAEMEAYRSPVAVIDVRRADDGFEVLADGVPMAVELGEDGTFVARLASGEEFRGQKKRRSVEGFWIRPGTDFGGQVLASPFVLKREGRGHWRGAPNVLAEDFHLFVYFGEEDGEPFAAVRNPQRNFIGAAGRYDVAIDEDRQGELFVERGERRWARSFSYDQAADSIAFDFLASGEPFTLRPATDEQAARYYPRAEGFAGLSVIPRLDDGWPVRSPEASGFDQAKLEELVRSLVAVDPASPRPDLIHSLVIAHQGAIVVEEYFYGHDREQKHDIRSAGKTYAALLTGAMIEKGLDIDADTEVMPILRQYDPTLPADDQRERITLGNLLSHQSGLACDDTNGSSPGNEDNLWQQGEDFWSFTASLPIAHDPDTIYAYCSAGINLVGAVMETASGQGLLSLINDRMMEPMGIDDYHWNLMPNGNAYFGGGARLRPRDLLKMGQVALDGGRWRGRRVVDADWQAQSVETVIEVNPETTGKTEEDFANTSLLSADGLAWHLNDIEVGDRVFASYEANGNGGQTVIVVPELELVVTTTGGLYGWGSIWTGWRDRFVGGVIIPALIEAD